MKSIRKNLTIRLELELWKKTRSILFAREITFQRFLVKQLERLAETNKETKA